MNLFLKNKKRVPAFLVTSLLLICFFSQLLEGQERPEIEFRKKGGILFREVTYDIVTTPQDSVEVEFSFAIDNIGTDPVESISFDILIQTGELESVAFRTGDQTLDHDESIMEAHYLYDVFFEQTLMPENSTTVQGNYSLLGILQQDGADIKTRVPLLVPIVVEASGKTEIAIAMEGPLGFKCAQAIPQPASKEVVDECPHSTWEMSMIPPSLLFVTYKPIGTTSISINTVILAAIIIWAGIVAVYGYRKLR
ncbi:MAG: hypothetical protein HXS41_12525 [Theionarchaea archaeon]|nr:hypothetical protein [Theionarchaea archaeon]MBU7001417.1 hypothetical protein [Theionarchaea archaeon]MBU7021878.1 hypothetical protein [Theionarchaea archaeon]MBU7034330.1 hypothetical protein [Theionarchaea archaeon]MBU7040295.1 hypothetical protein [Theionarchaea archaeon]